MRNRLFNSRRFSGNTAERGSIETQRAAGPRLWYRDSTVAADYERSLADEKRRRRNAFGITAAISIGVVGELMRLVFGLILIGAILVVLIPSLFHLPDDDDGEVIPTPIKVAYKTAIILIPAALLLLGCKLTRVSEKIEEQIVVDDRVADLPPAHLLVRASDEPTARPEELLRPAEASSDLSSHQLLRSSEDPACGSREPTTTA